MFQCCTCCFLMFQNLYLRFLDVSMLYLLYINIFEIFIPLYCIHLQTESRHWTPTSVKCDLLYIHTCTRFTMYAAHIRTQDNNDTLIDTQYNSGGAIIVHQAGHLQVNHKSSQVNYFARTRALYSNYTCVLSEYMQKSLSHVCI